MSSVLWSYGVLLSSMVEHDDIRFSVALWTPALFLATVCLTDPWCRLPVIKGSSGKRRKAIATWMLRPISVAGILLVCGALAVTPFIRPRELHLLTFGVLSGLGSSLALTQSELLMDQYFPPRRKRRRQRVLCLACIRFGSSLSQFVSPLLMMAVIGSYGRHQAPLLHSGYVLHALIAAALIKFRSNGSTKANVRLRSMSYSKMEEDDGTEDTEWRCGPHRISEGEILLPFEEDLAGRSWKNPAKDETTSYDLKDDDDDIDAEDALESANEPASNILGQPKRRNCYGVEILPQIPEETEEEDSGDARQNKRSSRRLTITLPNNNNNHKVPSEVDNPSNGSNFHNGNYLPDTPTSASSTTFLITPNKSLRKYKRWKWRRRKWRRRRVKKEEEDMGEEEEGIDEVKRGPFCCVREVLDPRGFCKGSFYPALALSTSSKLGNLVFFSMVPHVARLLGKSKNDCTLLVALAGFSSLLMAAVLPLISFPSPKTKVAGFFAPRTCKKFTYSIGSIISAIALFLLSRCDTYDRLTLASLLFGIGSGATADTAGSVLHVAYGGWESVSGSRGLINTLSSFIIIGFTASIGIYIAPATTEATSGMNGTGVGSLTLCFSMVAIFQFMAGIFWPIQSILSRFYRRQRNYMDWSNGMFLQAT
ncbi:hypothetical protein J437_LFUL011788 [Ladona fulva]|uniref:Uncharacterized protein n=1 Tax=Ladona fulva TaxID=123851 RepID=A0A8K0P1F9_LADFU|nr:hypothetical protein J437_LFUL011788 [Ladona fulva]